MVGWDENNCVGSLYSAGGAMGEMAEFFAIGIFPYGAVFRVLDEVMVLQEITGVCVKDGRECVMGETSGCNLLWCERSLDVMQEM